MAELNEQLKSDIEEACKKAGLTTPVEDVGSVIAILALFGWVWYKVRKAGEQGDDDDGTH